MLIEGRELGWERIALQHNLIEKNAVFARLIDLRDSAIFLSSRLVVDDIDLERIGRIRSSRLHSDGVGEIGCDHEWLALKSFHLAIPRLELHAVRRPEAVFESRTRIPFRTRQRE